MKRKLKYQIGAVLLSAIMVVGVTGCGSKKSAGTETKGGTAGSDSAGEMTANADFVYPMEETTFTINYGNDPYNLEKCAWVGEDLYHTKLKEATGITLKDVGALPNAYDPSEEFLLLLASGEYPDLFWCNWVSFPGGPQTAIEDGYIISLNDYGQYMPNYMKYLEENPEIEKMVKTDDGTLYCFPYVRDDGKIVETGAMIRQDLLDQMDLEVPTTIDEWHEVLTAFKDAGIKSPLSFESRWLFLEYSSACISSAFNTAYPFYVMGDDVKFGPLESGYKDFIEVMRQWYAEGLIDRDMPSVDKSTVAAKMTNGESAMTINQLVKVDSILKANEGTDFTLAGVPSAVLKEGDAPEFSHYRNAYGGSYSISISSQCSDIEKACRYVDYLFSEEGHMLTNFGTEGVSYTVKDGEVQFTDNVLNNPSAAISETRERYAMYYNWPNAGEQSSLHLSEIDKAIQETWMANMEMHTYPTIIHTPEETEIITEKYSTIDDYCREMILKYIIGTEDMAGWDSFVQQLRSYGIEDVLACKQAAYDRYQAR